nr:MAG TPA: hypothetical protein [Caudoviricetes sp.]
MSLLIKVRLTLESFLLEREVQRKLKVKLFSI